MDYEVFLVSRMREEYVHGRPAVESVVHGFSHGARVVTAAAAIMIGVFGGFALGDDAIVKSIGFGLAFGILADAFLVRMTLVPAFMALLGDRMWWLPRWLDRAMPNLDIEGEALARHTEQVAAQREREREMEDRGRLSGRPGQAKGTRSRRSSPAAGVARPSRLEVPTHRESSGAAATARTRPWPSRCRRTRPRSGPSSTTE